MLLLVPAFAQAEYADLVQCLKSVTGSEQKQCTQALFRQAVEELEKAYTGVLEKAARVDADPGNSTSAAIAESQRAWEIYRDAECRGVGGGSGRMVWVFGCLAETTRERLRELNAPFYQR